MTHPTCAAEAPNSALMTGIRTLIIVAVSTVVKTARATTVRKRRVDAGCSAPIALPPALIVRPRRARCIERDGFIEAGDDLTHRFPVIFGCEPPFGDVLEGTGQIERRLIDDMCSCSVEDLPQMRLGSF